MKLLPLIENIVDTKTKNDLTAKYNNLLNDYKELRNEIDKHPELRLALEHTTYLYQIARYWKNFDQSLLCTPKELYEDIKKLGYKWEELLQTRNYWTFDQYTNPIRYLSTIDLLKMRAGLYTPYWMDV